MRQTIHEPKQLTMYAESIHYKNLCVLCLPDKQAKNLLTICLLIVIIGT